MGKQFEQLRASSLYCNKCQAPRPVREKLLLILPDRDKFEYLCTHCGQSLGEREVTHGDLRQAQAMARRAAPSRSTLMLP